MKALKEYQRGGEINLDDNETNREKNARKVEERNIKRWKRRYKRFRRKGGEAGHDASLYATKPWLEKDKLSISDIMGKLSDGFQNLRKGPKVKGTVDKGCKDKPAWAK